MSAGTSEALELLDLVLITEFSDFTTQHGRMTQIDNSVSKCDCAWT